MREDFPCRNNGRRPAFFLLKHAAREEHHRHGPAREGRRRRRQLRLVAAASHHYRQSLLVEPLSDLPVLLGLEAYSSREAKAEASPGAKVTLKSSGGCLRVSNSSHWSSTARPSS